MLNKNTPLSLSNFLSFAPTPPNPKKKKKKENVLHSSPSNSFLHSDTHAHPLPLSSLQVPEGIIILGRKAALDDMNSCLGLRRGTDRDTQGRRRPPLGQAVDQVVSGELI